DRAQDRPLQQHMVLRLVEAHLERDSLAECELDPAVEEQRAPFRDMEMAEQLPRQAEAVPQQHRRVAAHERPSHRIICWCSATACMIPSASSASRQGGPSANVPSNWYVQPFSVVKMVPRRGPHLTRTTKRWSAISTATSLGVRIRSPGAG